MTTPLVKALHALHRWRLSVAQNLVAYGEGLIVPLAGGERSG
jgi:hypothetical protein